LGTTLAVTHAHFCRLLRDRLIRENTDPDATAPLDVTRHHAARSLDLAGRQAATAHGLEAVLTEAHLVAGRRNTLVTTLLHLAVFLSSWLQHFSPPTFILSFPARR